VPVHREGAVVGVSLHVLIAFARCGHSRISSLAFLGGRGAMGKEPIHRPHAATTESPCHRPLPFIAPGTG
jgi:hypothetical protein